MRNSKVLTDGTVLYRRTMSTATVRLTGEQFNEINRLRNKELAAALIPVFPITGLWVHNDERLCESVWLYLSVLLLTYGVPTI